MIKTIKNQLGFTFVELLVVVTITVILAAAGMATYGQAQMRARDSRRKADLTAMKGALEEYFVATSSTYPVSCNSASTYLSGPWPSVDPKGTAYAVYCDADSYVVCATMEAGSGGNASAPATNANGAGLTWASSGAYFCLQNQQ